MNDQNTKSDNDKPSSRLNFNYPVPDNQQSQSRRKTIRRSRPVEANVQPAMTAVEEVAPSLPSPETTDQPRAVSAPPPENQISSPPVAHAPATKPVKNKLLHVWPFGR